MLITIFNAGGKGVGFFREIVFASNFGIEKELDIYFVSSIIPLILSTSIFYIAQNFLIPAFAKKKVISTDLPSQYLRRSLAIALPGSMIISLLLFLLRDTILHYFFESNDILSFSVGSTVLNLFILSLPLYTVVSILTAWKYYSYEYLAPLVSQLWPNLAIIMSVLLFSSNLGAESIAYGYFAGVGLQFGQLVWGSRNDIFQKFRYSGGGLSESKSAMGLLVIFLIEFIGQLMPFIDRSFYASLPSGTISAYNYALTLMMLPISIVAMGFSTALFPQISELFSSKNTKELHNKLSISVELILFLFLPVQLLIMLFPEQLIRMIFIKSKFSGADITMIKNCLMVLGGSILFYALFSVVSKFLYGISKPGALLSVIVSGFLVKIVINVLLLDHLGYITIAFSTAASFTVMFIFGGILLVRNLNYSGYDKFWALGRILLVFLILALPAIYFRDFIISFSYIGIFLWVLLSLLLYMILSKIFNIAVFELILGYVIRTKRR